MSRASKSDAIVVRLRGVEVLAVPDTVTSFRCGKLPASASLILEQVYTDASRGAIASEAACTAATGFGDARSAALFVLSHGEYPMSVKERKEAVEAVRRQTVHYIHVNYVNPTGRTPYSPTLIESVLAELRFAPALHTPIPRQFEAIHRAFNDKLRIIAVPDGEASARAAMSGSPGKEGRGKGAKLRRG